MSDSQVNFGYSGNCLGMDEYRLDLFWDKVNIGDDSECWNWTAGCHPKGYGQFKFNGSTWRSHRISFALHNGSLPNGDKPYVCHKCVNNKACVNPMHLYAGSHQDNMDDRNADGGYDNAKSGSDHPMSKLTEEDVLEIRRLYAGGGWTLKRLGDKFGVSFQHISSIIKGKYWK